ncbi:MAG: hypothetical protein HYY85_03155, partial [Deltaproteobacteria bacterium]|nr:hypothetical protein [Deltaproteobacteria bacterium]
MEKVRTTLTLDPRIRQEMARLKRECEGLSISAMVNAFLGAIVATARTYRGSRLRLAADVQREIEELRRRLEGGARAGEGREAARRPAPRRTRQRPRLYGIFRERMYSPEREEDDAEILRLTAKHLVAQGWEVELRTVESLTGDDRLPVVFAMCEGRQALERLAEWEAQGSVVINRPAGVLNCYRARMVA